MKNNSSSPSFRNVLGGFKKSDVIAYIAEENKKFTDAENFYREEISNLQKRIEELEDISNAAEKDRASAEKRLNATIEELRVNIEERDRIIDEANGEAARYKALSESAESVRKAYVAEIENLKFTLGELTKENGKLKEENSSLSELNMSLADSKKLFENELEKANEKLSELEAKADSRPLRAARTLPSFSAEANEVSEVSTKAIRAIKSIKSEVEDYVTDCVGEFDSCSHDVSTGIYKLLAEINQRCKLLEARIEKSREKANYNINSHFDSFDESHNG